MNSELIFEGKKYISSKRASQISRYNQDYIGQLIRDSKIDARRVGRSWFVSLESLEKHVSEKKGEALKLPAAKVRSTESGESAAKPLFLGGEKYVSTKEASDVSGYARDYIGQLVREKKIEAKMVGRAWFISLPSLEKHLKKQAEENALKDGAKEIVSPFSVIASEVVADYSPKPSYERESLPIIPALAKKTIAEETRFVAAKPAPAISYPTLTPAQSFALRAPFGMAKRTIAAIAIVLSLAFGTSLVNVVMERNVVAVGLPNNAAASVFSVKGAGEFAVEWYRDVEGMFSGVGRFVAGLFGTRNLAYQTATPAAQEEAPAPVSQGMVVVPKTDEGEQQIERIKNSFSDQVGVSRNPDGTTGVIQPVFKQVSGDQYLYVLVPVKEQKQ